MKEGTITINISGLRADQWLILDWCLVSCYHRYDLVITCQSEAVISHSYPCKHRLPATHYFQYSPYNNLY